jgi:hypothetical protein
MSDWVRLDCSSSSEWMEKIMSKTNDTSKLDHAKLENRVLQTTSWTQ